LSQKIQKKIFLTKIKKYKIFVPGYTNENGEGYGMAISAVRFGRKGSPIFALAQLISNH
jgi:hypothetical protein